MCNNAATISFMCRALPFRPDAGVRATHRRLGMGGIISRNPSPRVRPPGAENGAPDAAPSINENACLLLGHSGKPDARSRQAFLEVRFVSHPMWTSFLLTSAISVAPMLRGPTRAMDELVMGIHRCEAQGTPRLGETALPARAVGGTAQAVLWTS